MSNTPLISVHVDCTACRGTGVMRPNEQSCEVYCHCEAGERLYQSVQSEEEHLPDDLVLEAPAGGWEARARKAEADLDSEARASHAALQECDGNRIALGHAHQKALAELDAVKKQRDALNAVATLCWDEFVRWDILPAARCRELRKILRETIVANQRKDLPDGP